MLNQLKNNMLQPTSNVTTCTWGNDGMIKYPEIYGGTPPSKHYPKIYGFKTPEKTHFTFTDVPKEPFKLPGTYDCPSCMKLIKTYCDGMAEMGKPIDEEAQCKCAAMGTGADLSKINSLADLTTITWDFETEIKKEIESQSYDNNGFYTTTTMTKFMGLPVNTGRNMGVSKIPPNFGRKPKPPKPAPKYRNHWLEVIEEKKQMKINFDGRKDSDWELDV